MRLTSKKILIILMIVAILAILIPTTVQAAGSFSVKSSASITTGKTTTITVTTANCEGKFTVSSSNTSVATVSTSSFWGDEKGTTITITGKSAGTATITVTPVDVTDTDLNDVTGAQTCKVTVTDPAPESTTTTPSTNTGTSSGSTGSSSTGSSSNNNSSSSSSSNKPATTTTTVQKSSNSKLYSLQVAEGVISPEFSSSVTEYQLSVPNEVTTLNITAEADSSKASVRITGNEELQIGDNNIEIIVTAEDGSQTTYKILAKRAQPELSLQKLSITYIDENGEQKELILNPAFAFNVYEYNVDAIIPHTVKSLEILGTANRENAAIEIVGNEELITGENIITIKVTVTDEAGLEEQKTYTIKVEKEEEPVVGPLSVIEKIKNWFSGVGSTVSTWYTENYNTIIKSLLVVATVAYIGLTIYYIYDYKKYQQLLSKIAELNKINLMEKANVALNPENTSSTEEINNVEKTEPEVETSNITIDDTTTKPEIKFNRGRRFK